MLKSLEIAEIKHLENVSFNYDLYNRFIEYTDVKETTLKSYKSHLLHFFDYIKDNEILKPTRENIKEYKNYINNHNYTARHKKSVFKSSKTLF